ncbi:putative membrane protein [Methanocalculus alkaliphilus]|uniref:carotenoid biosynthesis protein n=1 Tax=Methanocalculus alkaliphilus TaxID=768730 RepID=UPI00209FAA94|nr:carotenoid biosynthesis protein [Methanocalculus alkaliphilus]MCP1714968.1 putative membrane protein [Methanocalculus alkaliphilus]
MIRRDLTTALMITAVILFLAGFLVIRFDTDINIPAISGLFIIAMALPSYYILCKEAGFGRGILLLIILSIIPLIIEAQAIVTGLPYGEFHYSDDLGLRLFDLVPLTVAFAYLPILLGAFTIASHLAGTHPWRLITGSALLLVLIDLAIDPAIVHAGLWIWPGGGVYYGVPAINFLGWLLTGLIYSGILYLGMRERLMEQRPIAIGMASSLLLIIALWTGYLLYAGLLIPFIIGCILLITLLHMTRQLPFYPYTETPQDTPKK